MHSIDLTPFGFTPTESLVYAALLRLGPSTGYAVAQMTRLARANAYAALEGLVTRGTAHRTPGRPARYRPSDPQTLLAQLAALQGEALDRLSRALEKVTHPAEPVIREVAGGRALANVVQQLVARAARTVHGVLAAELWAPTVPAWRRAAARAEVDLLLAGDPGAVDTAGIARGTVDARTPTLLLVDDAHTITADGHGDAIRGLWSSHPLIAGLARAALGAGS